MPTLNIELHFSRALILNNRFFVVTSMKLKVTVILICLLAAFSMIFVAPLVQSPSDKTWHNVQTWTMQINDYGTLVGPTQIIEIIQPPDVWGFLLGSAPYLVSIITLLVWTVKVIVQRKKHEKAFG